MAAGFYLDYTSAARYATLHYDTFAQLFAHESRYRSGWGRAVLSPRPTMKICRRRPSCASMKFFTAMRPGRGGCSSTSDQAPQFDTVAAQLLLANDHASINWFDADLDPRLGPQLVQRPQRSSGDLLGERQQQRHGNNTSYDQSIGTFTEYHFSERFALGPGYRFYDFMSYRAGTTRRTGALAVCAG